MPREVTWRSWAVLGAAAAVYGVLGWWLSSNGTAEAWIYRIGLTAAPAAALLFAAAYAVVARGWWRNDVGANLVRIALAAVPTTVPLAYVFWFNGGMLTSSWLAWLAVSGPAVSALFMTRASWIWYRIGRSPSAYVHCPAGHAAPATALYCPACGLRIGGEDAPAA